MARLTRYATAFAVVALAVIALGAGRASAGLFGCNYPTLSQPFAAWGDLTRYYLSPGGGFETPGWKLSGAAGIVSGNESYFANASSDSHALTLQPGGTAQSPYSCIFALDLKVRMFVRSDTSSPVRVDIVVPGVLGLVKVASSYTIETTPDWQPTSVVVNLLNVLSATNLTSANISVRVTPVGGGPVQVDDVYIDPSGWE